MPSPHYALPVSVTAGENRDGVANPAESLVPQWLKAFAPRTNVREHSRARRQALRANFPRKRLHQPELLAVCSNGTDQPVARAARSIAVLIVCKRPWVFGLSTLCQGKNPDLASAREAD